MICCEESHLWRMSVCFDSWCGKVAVLSWYLTVLTCDPGSLITRFTHTQFVSNGQQGNNSIYSFCCKNDYFKKSIHIANHAPTISKILYMYQCHDATEMQKCRIDELNLIQLQCWVSSLQKDPFYLCSYWTNQKRSILELRSGRLFDVRLLYATCVREEGKKCLRKSSHSHRSRSPVLYCTCSIYLGFTFRSHGEIIFQDGVDEEKGRTLKYQLGFSLRFRQDIFMPCLKFGFSSIALSHDFWKTK